MKKTINLCVALAVLLTASCGETTTNPGQAGNTATTEATANTATEIPAALQVPFVTLTADASAGGTITVPGTKTSIHVPANAFVYENGSPVTGHVEIKFREYTNSAEIAFSQLPMTYMQNGEELRMSSSGMFQLTGSAAGQAVQIAPGQNLTIDYELAQLNPDLAFFYLDPADGQWQMMREIQPEKMTETNDHAVKVIKKDCDTLLTLTETDEMMESEMASEPDAAETNQNAQTVTVAGMQETNALPTGWSEEDREQWKRLGGSDENYKFVTRTVALNADSMRTLAADENLDAGSLVYTFVARSLTLNNFGTYNCDQLLRIASPVVVRPDFVDEDGNSISNGRFVSVVDLNINGAFSYSTSSFTCSSRGSNVVLLYTEDGDIYGYKYGTKDGREPARHGPQTLQMELLTGKVATSEDLGDYLKQNS